MASYRSREEVLIYEKKVRDKESEEVKTEREETHGGSGLGGRGRKSAWE